MKHNAIKIFSLAALIAFCGCNKGPLEEIGYVSNERAIENFKVPGQVGAIDIVRTPDVAEVTVKVLANQIDMSAVTPEIMVSLGATVVPASGETVNFAENGNQMTYTVTSESGISREWTVKIEEFRLPGWLDRTWTLPGPASGNGGSPYAYSVTGPDDAAKEKYPGQQPLGRLTNHLDTKGYMIFLIGADGANKYTRPLTFYKWANFIPSIIDDYDNTFRFSFDHLNDDATCILGTFKMGAGADGKYTEFPEIVIKDASEQVNRTLDLEKLLRRIPKEGTFEFDLTTEIMKLYDKNGRLYSMTSTRGTIIQNDGKTAEAIGKVFTYDEAACTLQMRFRIAPEEQQKLKGSASMYSGKLTLISSNTVDYVNITGSNAVPQNLYLMSGTEEVWYDFVELKTEE